MSGKVLVIVESPTKARTIKRFLPSNYIIEASIGHIRDLPQSASDIPKKYKAEKWAKLGIDVEHDFKPLYILPRGKSKIIREIKSKMKEADLLLLATDEDREGESISWHLVDQLKPKIPYKRMVFHEITKKAIHQALESGREIDEHLVNAQETRRILDRLYGYTLSPLLWKKIAFGLSAGRVQSPGLRLIVERERERLLFSSSTYWDAKAKLCRCDDSSDYHFEAKLESIDGIRIAGSKDFDSTTGKYSEKNQVLRLSEKQTEDLLQEIRTSDWIVGDIQERKNRTKPAQPFTTSTLQQEGNRKLRLSTRETMRIAQRLYESGLITYMRTDSPSLSEEGLTAARNAVEASYGREYLTKIPRKFNASTKGAQEAHEAIRPAGEICRHPDSTGLDGKELSLYTLIWKRTLASQMAEAEKALTTVKVDAGKARFTATGSRIIFPGFLRVYVEGKDDPEAALDNKETFLPAMEPGQKLALDSLDSVRHETKPPNRFTEASLVKELENMGIGRPSTYAAIINTLFERKYVRKQGTALVPTFIGFGVVQLLEKNFPDLIEYSFTSEMENALDEISLGKIDRIKYLKRFYSGAKGLKNKVDIQEKEIKPADSRKIKLPQITLVDGIRIGKFGPYILCTDEETGEELHASIPEDLTPAAITDSDVEKLITLQKLGPEPIGYDKPSGLPIYYMIGRYGPYFQLGEKTEANPKPRRASILSGKNHQDLGIDEISKLLSLPRELGTHPETGKPVIVNIGRFGPYVGHNKEFRSLKKEDDVYTVAFDRALALLAAPKRGKNGSAVIKDFGKSSSGDPLALYSGRYGVYLKHGKSNIALPDKYKKDEEEALKLTAEDVNKLI
ncbi:MAG: type I DNA topoisomerase [Spirochaetales bacterium]|nr:type I DNA topoisomerase [Spirochaetales bacterium]